MIRDVHPGSGSRIRILTFYPSQIPDPGVKKAPDPGSGSATLGTTVEYRTCLPHGKLKFESQTGRKIFSHRLTPFLLRKSFVRNTGSILGTGVIFVLGDGRGRGGGGRSAPFFVLRSLKRRVHTGA
jgi:hypothetical protein